MNFFDRSSSISQSHRYNYNNKNNYNNNINYHQLSFRDTQFVASGSIFARRTDYKAFSLLPKHKINSYHIKMEDDGSHGNDEVRWYILSNLSANKMTKACCIVCQTLLTIYDKYPLLEGAFFQSPVQHHRLSAKVKTINATNTSSQHHATPESKFLTTTTATSEKHINAVCMPCLEGWTFDILCKFCFQPWIGSHFILGTMYDFDIFAAQPCCQARLSCNGCSGLVQMTHKQPANASCSQEADKICSQLPPNQEYFSHYSKSYCCESCHCTDNHFVKPISSLYILRNKKRT